MDHTNRLKRIQLVLGEFPPPSRRLPLDLKVIEETRTGSLIRRKISFATEPGDRCPAWILLPLPAGPPRPAMLCLHQTTAIGKDEPAGLGGIPTFHYALELAQRGYVTLAPDCEGFGDYQIDPYALGYASATMKNIWNHQRAMDLLVSLPQVDPHRIGTIGHSHGGHNSLFLAACEPRVKLVVTSCGFSQFTHSDNEGTGDAGDLTDWAGRHYMPRIASLYGSRAENMPFDMDDILSLIAPRPLFINAPTRDRVCPVKGVAACVDQVRPIYAQHKLLDNLVCEHPEATHDFPQQVRQRAFTFIDHHLKDAAQ